MKFIGIDLSGQPSNPSGFALLSGRTLTTGHVYSDEEMIELCARERPAIVSIDAPLSLPRRGNLRKADLSLIERGLRVFPPTFAGMRSLTERGIRLARELRRKGIRAIEVHPRTSGVILFGTPDREVWAARLRRMGFQLRRGRSRHEMDAAVAALTGALHQRGKTEVVGDAREGTIVIPIRRGSSPA